MESNIISIKEVYKINISSLSGSRFSNRAEQNSSDLVISSTRKRFLFHSDPA